MDGSEASDVLVMVSLATQSQGHSGGWGVFLASWAWLTRVISLGTEAQSFGLLDPKLCYLLDGILFIYGVIVTALFLRAKVGTRGSGEGAGLSTRGVCREPCLSFGLGWCLGLGTHTPSRDRPKRTSGAEPERLARAPERGATPMHERPRPGQGPLLESRGLCTGGTVRRTHSLFPSPAASCPLRPGQLL